jgi:hypothetical protein
MVLFLLILRLYSTIPIPTSSRSDNWFNPQEFWGRTCTSISSMSSETTRFKTFINFLFRLRWPPLEQTSFRLRTSDLIKLKWSKAKPTLGNSNWNFCSPLTGLNSPFWHLDSGNFITDTSILVLHTIFLYPNPRTLLNSSKFLCRIIK